MNKVNQLVLSKDEYNSEADFLNAFNTAVKLLLDAGYIMTIRYDEKAFGIISIEYNYANREYCATYPYWLTYEQAEALCDMEMENE